ncbi:hypothetical protein [Gordonia sp. FQ]|uniref:hypothetical protein n=1 Tax=Gordonia sp. FQ TaxID=3446634 RepID=UPI003F86E014
MSPRIDSIRTVPADDGARRGRLAKATQFQSVAEDVLELADVHTDVADAAVTLFVHAGIAAADAICAAALGKYARGQDHGEAVGLLNSVDPESARALNTLLGMKTGPGTATPRSAERNWPGRSGPPANWSTAPGSEPVRDLPWPRARCAHRRWETGGGDVQS